MKKIFGKRMLIIIAIIAIFCVLLFVVYKNINHENTKMAVEQDENSNSDTISLTTIQVEEDGKTATKTAIKVAVKADEEIKKLEVEEKSENGKWEKIFSKKDYDKKVEEVNEEIQTSNPFGENISYRVLVNGDVYGSRNYRSGAGGTLYDILRDSRLNHICEVQSGIMESECLNILQNYFLMRRKKS